MVRTEEHYRKILGRNPHATIDQTLAADMIYAARHHRIDVVEARGTDEWRGIVLRLRETYGADRPIDVADVRREMDLCVAGGNHA